MLANAANRIKAQHNRLHLSIDVDRFDTLHDGVGDLPRLHDGVGDLPRLHDGVGDLPRLHDCVGDLFGLIANE